MANNPCSTENLVALPLLAKSLVVSERVTATTIPPLAEERPGRGTTLSASGDTDKRLVPESDDCGFHDDTHGYTNSMSRSQNSSCGGDGALVRMVCTTAQCSAQMARYLFSVASVKRAIALLTV